MLHGILFGADGGSHSWDLWSVRRQNFRSAFCSTRGEPLDDRNNRHISHLLSKFAALSVYVGADRLKLRRTNVSLWMYVETFTFEWRKKNESVRPGLLLIASKLAHQLAGKPIEFLLEELRKRRKGELEIRTRTQTKLKHSPPLNATTEGKYSRPFMFWANVFIVWLIKTQLVMFRRETTYSVVNRWPGGNGS